MSRIKWHIRIYRDSNTEVRNFKVWSAYKGSAVKMAVKKVLMPLCLIEYNAATKDYTITALENEDRIQTIYKLTIEVSA